MTSKREFLNLGLRVDGVQGGVGVQGVGGGGACVMSTQLDQQQPHPGFLEPLPPPHLKRCRLLRPSFRDSAADGNSAAHLYTPVAPPLPVAAPPLVPLLLSPAAGVYWGLLPPLGAATAAGAAAGAAMAAGGAAPFAGATADPAGMPRPGSDAWSQLSEQALGLMGQCQDRLSGRQEAPEARFLQLMRGRAQDRWPRAVV